jgi:hypothetical protein
MAAPFLWFLRCWIYGKNCQQILAEFARGLWQELPTNVGKHMFVRYAAKNELETAKPVHSGRERPPKPEGILA